MDSVTVPIRQTSPKRKRISKASEENDKPESEPGVYERRLEFVPVQTSALRSTIGMSGDEAEHALPKVVSEGDSAPQHGPDSKYREKMEAHSLLIKAMTTAQHTQVQSSGDLLKLADNLHNWACHLEEQERWLYGEQLRIVEQQQALTNQYLDFTTGHVERLNNEAEPQKTPGHELDPSDTEQQLKGTIVILENSIETLISELQIEKVFR
ncbi:hypothetical protein C7974DRAFT_443009 [Boeremia exigua]|uniref:uncharacterized protein n=1 Tax=Boeremia exigua TaxID=749465 RepID=UPI001E8E71D8|nr:uncharacterized protein C7974DRAFT_443009 [Boeremia exigua]KAH6614971.1 hypothetical protein C7974DRAFT_443009 [Boeremia exigua]